MCFCSFCPRVCFVLGAACFQYKLFDRRAANSEASGPSGGLGGTGNYFEHFRLGLPVESVESDLLFGRSVGKRDGNLEQ